MVTTSEARVEAQFEELADKRPLWISVKNFARKQPLGTFGALVVILMLVAALFADIVAPFDPEQPNYADLLTAPNLTYIMGTDEFGRDIFSRIIYGARTALMVGFISAFVGATTGLVLGVASAYFGGLFDLLFQRIMDILMAFPLIILALSVIAIFGAGDSTVQMDFLTYFGGSGEVVIPSYVKVIGAITLPFIPRCARVVRSSALAIREIPYIDAARANGYSHARIILRHMVPNVMAPYLIMITAFVGQAILLEASLTYLGLGVQEPTPAWGLMLQGGAEQFARSAIWVPVWPGIAISLAVFGFNLFGDAVRDTLDPRLRSQ